MKIVIGTDHRGFAHKEFIKQNFCVPGKNISWIDVGCSQQDSCDYPIFAERAAQTIQSGQADLGILLCGTGVGMSIAANRFKGIYAGLAWTEEIARLNREHDNVNILVLPADYISNNQVLTILEAWITAEFLEERHKKRIEMIDQFGGM